MRRALVACVFSLHALHTANAKQYISTTVFTSTCTSQSDLINTVDTPYDAQRILEGRTMASLLRQIVAGPRAKHAETGLDLCYVTDDIIVT